MYNSAIFTTTTIYEYQAIFVSPEFVRGANFTMQGPFEAAGLKYGSNHRDLVDPSVEDITALQIQAQKQNLSQLSTSDCVKRFLNPMINDVSALIVVAKDSPVNKTGSVLATLNYYTPLEAQRVSAPGPTGWVCNYGTRCDNMTQHLNEPWHLMSNYGNVTVDHCLTRNEHQRCNVEMSVLFMTVVVVCNVIKLICFSVCLSIKNHKPFVTIGDAICSFLTSPDQTSSGLGPVSSEEIRRSAWRLHREAAALLPDRLPKELVERPGRMWKHHKQMYFSVVSLGRWAATALVSSLILLAGIGLLLSSSDTSNIKDYFTAFRFDANKILPGTFTLFAAVVSANAFQLAISNAYIFFNNVFTCMRLSAEIADFSVEAKAMRVSEPRGVQRSTYWLQLPYRWSLPLMAIMALLHWLVSGAVFMVNVKVLSAQSQKMTGYWYGDKYIPLSFFGE